jgi:hypothetical protein
MIASTTPAWTQSETKRPTQRFGRFDRRTEESGAEDEDLLPHRPSGIK